MAQEPTPRELADQTVTTVCTQGRGLSPLGTEVVLFDGYAITEPTNAGRAAELRKKLAFALREFLYRQQAEREQRARFDRGSTAAERRGRR